jgi:AraC family transcriptional regulator of adaptative response/methylated-DNA-[protein]-cysteine methyltransferase
VELGGGKAELLARAKKRFPKAEFVPGVAPAYADLPRAALDLRGTAFQLAVWEALRRIPSGVTRTYAQVARALGRPKAVRAVARACASNPAALIVPCHRVVGSDGSLRGYRWGVARKKKLLALEAA